MSNEKIELRIYAPAGRVLTADVRQVEMETEQGEVGVLSMHTDYVTTLGIGLLKYYPVGAGEIKKVAISGGFAAFAEGALIVLADTVDLPGQYKPLTEKEIQTLREIVEKSSGYEAAWQVASDKLKRNQVASSL